MSSRILFRALPAALSVTLFWLAGCASSGGSPTATTTAEGYRIGSVASVHVDEGYFTLAEDARTGSALGQGGETRVPVGRATGASGLRVGNRVRVLTDAARGGEAVDVQVLNAPAQPLPWGSYLHGSIASINHASGTATIQQVGSLNAVRVRHDASTVAVALDGSPLPLSALREGDEVDIVLRLVQPDPVASRIVRID